MSGKGPDRTPRPYADFVCAPLGGSPLIPWNRGRHEGVEGGEQGLAFELGEREAARHHPVAPPRDLASGGADTGPRCRGRPRNGRPPCASSRGSVRCRRTPSPTNSKRSFSAAGYSSGIRSAVQNIDSASSPRCDGASTPRKWQRTATLPGVLHVPVGTAPRHRQPVLQIGDHRRISGDLVVAGALCHRQGLGPLDLQGLAGRLQQHEVLVPLVDRRRHRVVQPRDHEHDRLRLRVLRPVPPSHDDGRMDRV